MSELDELRRGIDEIDSQISELFRRRLELTARVGDYKQTRGIPVLDPAREEIVRERRVQGVEDPQLKRQLVSLFDQIMAISRRQQRERMNPPEPQVLEDLKRELSRAGEPVESPRVIFQGEPGAYGEQACLELFGQDCRREKRMTFEEVFRAVSQGEGDYGVLPIENSSAGSIHQVYDLLAQYGCFIVQEHCIRVEHYLMAPPGATLEGIRRVYSHEQGFFQSEAFLKQHPEWECTPRLNTAESARFVAQAGDVSQAAIAARRAADCYGLHVLAGPINSHGNNSTRFVVVSRQMERRPGRNKMSVLFSLPHEAGSLHRALSIFAVNGLNLLKLESRPIPEQSWEYLFFADFAGDPDRPETREALCDLAQMASRLHILGSYVGEDVP